MSAADLYNEKLVGLARAAHAGASLSAPDAATTLENPLCGDRVTIEVHLRQGAISAIAHRVRGCVLCEAAAAVIGRSASGATSDEVAAGRAAVAAVLAGGAPPPTGRWAEVAVFTPVAAVASRHRCVQLPFEALLLAMARSPSP